MRILFTADLHIRIGQKNIPRKWAISQYRIMFSELNRIFEEYDCDLEIHGGDIFDKIPTMEELSLYMAYLHNYRDRERIIFDGNHEATKKGDTFLKYLNPMLPSSTYISPSFEGAASFDILPYVDLHKNKKAKNDILFTHVRGEIPPHVKPEIDLDYFNQWKIVFAGDLHAHSNSQRNIVYPGSPRTVTFHRQEVELGVLVIDTDPINWEWVKIDVPELIRKTIEDPLDMIKTEYHHTIYELTGNVLALAKIDKDSELLDKKIIKHEEQPSLDLTGLTEEEELEKYLLQIVKLSKLEIEEVLEVFHAYN